MPLKILSLGFRLCFIMCSCIVAVRFSDIFNVLGAPCFAVIGCTVLVAVSMSFTLSRHSSIGRKPVSLLSCSFVDVGFLAFAMSIWSFSVVGSVMSCASGWYSGIVHWIL